MDGAGNQAWCRAQLRGGECEDVTADSLHFGHLAIHFSNCATQAASYQMFGLMCLVTRVTWQV